MVQSEEKTIYGERWHGRWAAAWRAPQWGTPDWRVYVQFGDDGDPGVYGKSLDEAIGEVGQALNELESMYMALKNFRYEQEQNARLSDL